MTITTTKSCSRTNSVKYHLNHTWTIEDFSLYHSPKAVPVESDKKYSSIWSSPFSPPSNDKLQFRLQLYPCGENEECKNYAGLYLQLVKWEGKDIKVKFTMSILKADGEVFISEDSDVILNGIIGWGWPNFIKNDKLLNKDNDLLPDDVLTIQCNVTVIADEVTESGLDTSERMQQLAFECTKQQLHNWSSLLSTGEKSDVIFLVDDKELPAHKLVLSTQSTVFKAMFESGCKDSNEGQVEITDVDLVAFQEFLRFLYTGKATVDENALELMEIADKYATDTLKTLCEEYLASTLTINTVGPILVKADMHSAADLKSKAIQFIINNINTLAETENWEAGLEAHPKLYTEIFRQIGKTSTSRRC